MRVLGLLFVAITLGTVAGGRLELDAGALIVRTARQLFQRQNFSEPAATSTTTTAPAKQETFVSTYGIFIRLHH